MHFPSQLLTLHDIDMATRSILLAAGSNSGGQLGLGHAEDTNTLQECRCDEGVFPPDGLKVLQLSAGSNHTVALVRPSNDDILSNARDSNLQLWVCGSNRDGQLGRRAIDQENYNFRRLDLLLDLSFDALMSSKDSEIHEWQPVKIACGWHSTFIVLRHSSNGKDDKMIVVGRVNDFGQLGLGELKQIEAGIGLVQLRQANNIGGTLRIEAAACGLRHSVVQCRFIGKHKSDKVQVIGWGAARHGQLDSASTCKYPASYWLPHLVDEWESISAETFNNRIILAAGKEHTAYIRDDGSLRIIGSNRHGQLLIRDAVQSDTVLSAACTWNATLVLIRDFVIGSGNNEKGQLGAIVNSNGVAKIEMGNMLQSATKERQTAAILVCGSEHTLVLLQNGTESGGQVWGWGWNEHGNLAQADQEDRTMPVCIWPPRESNAVYRDSPATDVWAGCGTTFVQVRANYSN